MYLSAVFVPLHLQYRTTLLVYRRAWNRSFLHQASHFSTPRLTRLAMNRPASGFTLSVPLSRRTRRFAILRLTVLLPVLRLTGRATRLLVPRLTRFAPIRLALRGAALLLLRSRKALLLVTGRYAQYFNFISCICTQENGRSCNFENRSPVPVSC